MSPTSPLPRHALAAILIIIAAACAQAPQPPSVHLPPGPEGPVTPAPGTAAPAVSPSAEPVSPPPKPPETAAWTDPEPIAELTKSCQWAPPDEHSDPPSPLSCQVHSEQTCNPISCDIDLQDTCLPACKATCDTCAKACRTKCEACKAPCSGGACQKGCAGASGACLQGCLKEEDHCATGECGRAHAACNEKFSAEWEKSHCDKLHPRFDACIEACLQKPMRADMPEPKAFMHGQECEHACESSVLGARCGNFRAFFRVF